MKAFYIKPATKSVVEVDLPNPFKTYKDDIGGGSVEGVRPFPGHVLYVDGYGRDHEATNAGFHLGGVNICGDGMLCGVSRDLESDVRITIEEVEAAIRWYNIGEIPPVKSPTFRALSDEESAAFLGFIPEGQSRTESIGKLLR